jgi:hypothetical protein
MKIESVVCVPGPWADRDAMMRAVAELLGEDGPRFVMAGALMVELVSEAELEWRWEPRAEGLGRAFEIAGRGSLEASELAAIAAAPGHVFLIDPEGGSLQAARRVMIFAEALLRAGGLGVKVESAGVAHSAPAWREMTDAAHDVAALLAAWVTIVGAPEQGFFTCGMHNLGLPEALVPASLDPDAAVELLDVFTLYLAADEPELEDGQTFAADEDAPVFELVHQPCEHFAPDNPFHNPYGMWALLPLEAHAGETGEA